MANVITGRQIFADTVGTLWQGPVKINSIVFSDMLVAGHQAILQDQISRPVFNGLAGSELEPEASNKIGWAQGLKLTRIDSGNVIVYIE